MIKYFLNFIFLSFVFSSPVIAETVKDLNVFKGMMSHSQRTSLSLYNGLVYVGEFYSFLSGNELESVDAKSFSKLMSSFLTPEKFNDFQNVFKDKNLITKQELSSFGFELILDLSTFKLDLRTSEYFLNPKRISLNDYTVNQNEINVTSSPVSGFVNYSFTKTYTQEKNTSSRQNLIGNLDPNLNFYSVNLESHHNLGTDNKWVRTSSLLSKDFEESQTRISAGDIYYSPKVFQSTSQLFGMRFSKQFELSPYQIVAARGEREIYLETPSTVEIFINGFLIQTLNLEAGKHLLEDIPISQGINHIVLRISDNNGTKRYIFFQHTGSESLLKKGFHDFDYSVGKISKSGNRGIDYTDASGMSFYHRYGVNNNWTTGINGELKKNFFNLGPENQWATTKGLVVNNFSFSSGHQDYKGVAGRLAYFWTCPCGVDQHIKRFSAAYEYQSPRFLQNLFLESYTLNSQRHLLSLSFNENLTETISGIITTNFYSMDMQTIDKEQITLGLNKNFLNGLFLSSNIQRAYDRKAVKRNIDSVLLQLSYNFDGGKKNIVTTYNQSQANHTSIAEYTYNANKPVGNKIFRARVGENNSDQLASISGYYNHQKFELLGAYDYIKANESKTLTLNPSGSLAFAGSAFSFGQKIQQSFIIVDNLHKESLIVNGDEENHEAYLNAGRSATLTSVQPYVQKSVNIISDDNSSLGLSNKGYQVLTGYKRGSLLTIGNVLSKMAEGVLVNEAGKPYSLVGGKVVNLASGVEISFFTGRNGKFYLENLKPEIYQMMIYDRNTVRVFNLDLKNKLNEEKNDLGNIVIR